MKEMNVKGTFNDMDLVKFAPEFMEVSITNAPFDINKENIEKLVSGDAFTILMKIKEINRFPSGTKKNIDQNVY